MFGSTNGTVEYTLIKHRSYNLHVGRIMVLEYNIFTIPFKIKDA